LIWKESITVRLGSRIYGWDLMDSFGCRPNRRIRLRDNAGFDDQLQGKRDYESMGGSPSVPFRLKRRQYGGIVADTAARSRNRGHIAS
jgi:hypothetical protein